METLCSARSTPFLRFMKKTFRRNASALVELQFSRYRAGRNFVVLLSRLITEVRGRFR